MKCKLQNTIGQHNERKMSIVEGQGSEVKVVLSHSRNHCKQDVIKS